MEQPFYLLSWVLYFIMYFVKEQSLFIIFSTVLYYNVFCNGTSLLFIIFGTVHQYIIYCAYFMGVIPLKQDPGKHVL